MVLVCRDPKFIFLKTTKTGGTSIEMVLERFCLPPGTEIRERRRAHVGPEGIVGERNRRGLELRRRLPWPRPWYNHMPASELRRRIDPELWNAAVKVAPVRNPFRRTVSIFHWQNRGEDLTLSSFASVRDRFRRFVRGPWSNDLHIVSDRGSVVLDGVIRLERAAEDLAAFGDRLGLRIDPATMPHTKKSKTHGGGISLADYYDTATAEIVRKRMRWTFERTDYPTIPTDTEFAVPLGAPHSATHA